MQPLQVERPSRQREKPREQSDEQQARAPDREPQTICGWRASLRVGAPPALGAPLGCGRRAEHACQALAAIFSTRACIAQVLCSSCNCPIRRRVAWRGPAPSATHIQLARPVLGGDERERAADQYASRIRVSRTIMSLPFRDPHHGAACPRNGCDLGSIRFDCSADERSRCGQSRARYGSAPAASAAPRRAGSA